jgi:hypothetical protein
MCTEQLPPGGYPIAVKYIIPYHIKTEKKNCRNSPKGSAVPLFLNETP